MQSYATETQSESAPSTISTTVKVETGKANGQETKLSNVQSKSKKSSAIIRPFLFGRVLLPGQGGLNPCLCFIFCCGGTCTLQYGCVLVGLFQAIGGIIETFVYTMMLIFYETPPVLQYPKNMNLTDSDDDDIDELNFKSYTFLVLSSALFSFLPGIILCVAACKIHKALTLLYCALMCVSIVFGVGTAVYCSILISHIQFLGLNGAEARSALYFRTWCCFFILFTFRSYFLACAIGFYTQIKKGEYLTPPPLPIVRRSTDAGNVNPIISKPPLVSMPPPPPYPGYYGRKSFPKTNPPKGISSESPSHD